MKNEYFYGAKKEGYIFIKNTTLNRKAKKLSKLKLLNYILLFFFFFTIFFLIKKNIFSKLNIPSRREVSKSNALEINITNININNSFSYIFNDSSVYNISNKLNDMVFSEEELKYHSLFNAAKRAKDFINKSIDGILLNNNSFILNEKPKISIVIPVYNCEKTIKRAITSIQNQNFTDFEIILINDLSNDNSLEMINHLKKQDPRIKIFNNHKNMGTLYSRSIGVLYSNGKYIFPLDNDDMFLEKDVFYNIAIEIAEKSDFDIVEFRAMQAQGLKNFFKNYISSVMLCKYKKGTIVYQPQLSELPLRPTNKLDRYQKNELFIWGKCIKNEVYKKALMSYGEEKFSTYVTAYEDLIINFIIFQFAKSFIFVPKYGILKILSRSSAYYQASQKAKNKYEMRLLDAVFDFSRNTFEGKKVVVNAVLEYLNNNELELTLKNEKCKILLKSILERIFKCPYITEENKQIIKEKSLKFKLFNETQTI